MKKQHQDQTRHKDMQLMQKTDADLIIPDQDHDPKGRIFYNKSVGKRALTGAVAGGIIAGLLFWLVASGNIPVTGLGQISSADYSAAAFLGYIVGSAVGGLTGSFIGLYKIQKHY